MDSASNTRTFGDSRKRDIEEFDAVLKRFRENFESSKDIEGMKKILAEKDEKIAQLEVKCNTLENNSKHLREAGLHYKSKYEEIESGYMNALANTKSSLEAYNNMVKENESLKKEKATYNSLSNDSLEIMERNKKEIENLKNENMNLKKSCDDKSKLLEDCKKLVIRKEEDVKKMTEELKSLEHLVKTVRKETEEVRNLYDGFRQEDSAKIQALEGTIAEKDIVCKKYEELKKSFDDLSKKHKSKTNLLGPKYARALKCMLNIYGEIKICEEDIGENFDDAFNEKSETDKDDEIVEISDDNYDEIEDDDSNKSKEDFPGYVCISYIKRENAKKVVAILICRSDKEDFHMAESTIFGRLRSLQDKKCVLKSRYIKANECKKCRAEIKKLLDDRSYNKITNSTYETNDFDEIVDIAKNICYK